MTKKRIITRGELIRAIKKGPKTVLQLLKELGYKLHEIELENLKALAKQLEREGRAQIVGMTLHYIPPRLKAGHSRFKALMPNGKPRYIRCYDSGPEGFPDRYTVVYTGRKGGNYICMSQNPTHSQGVGMHGDGLIDRVSIDGKFLRPPTIGRKNHLGTRIDFDDLTNPCKHLVLSEYAETWNLALEDVVLAYGATLCRSCGRRQRVNELQCKKCHDTDQCPGCESMDCGATNRRDEFKHPEVEEVLGQMQSVMDDGGLSMMQDKSRWEQEHAIEIEDQARDILNG